MVANELRSDFSLAQLARIRYTHEPNASLTFLEC